jgi:hypothetical protein
LLLVVRFVEQNTHKMMKNMTKKIFEYKYKIVTNLDVDKVEGEKWIERNFERMFILILNDFFKREITSSYRR